MKVQPATIRKIAINTGGGDAPGLNAVIRAATLSALRQGWEVYGIRHGYRGLVDLDQTVRMSTDTVRGITHLGGTILGTVNRGNPFEYPLRTNGTEFHFVPLFIFCNTLLLYGNFFQDCSKSFPPLPKREPPHSPDPTTLTGKQRIGKQYVKFAEACYKRCCGYE